MAKYLREYDAKRWLKQSYNQTTPDEQISAYTVGDLCKHKSFSLWLLTDGESGLHSNFLHTLIAALASRKSDIHRFKFFLIDQDIINHKFNGRIRQEGGGLNEPKLDVRHYDIKNISIRDAIELAKLLSEHGEDGEIDDEEIVKLICNEAKHENIKVEMDAPIYPKLSERCPDVFPPHSE